MVLNAIKKRRSVREYKSEIVSDDSLKEIIKAAQFAPTAYGKKPIEFVIIKDQKTKDAIFNIVDQEYIKSAPVLIIPVSNSESALPVQDLSIASAHIFLQAAELGLGTVWKHLTPEWADKIKPILNIPTEYQMTNIIPLGFSAEEVPEHLETEFSESKIHVEKW